MHWSQMLVRIPLLSLGCYIHERVDVIIFSNYDYSAHFCCLPFSLVLLLLV